MQILKFSFLLIILGFIYSCVDQEFDAPPVQSEDNVVLPEVNTTIQELKAMHTLGQFTDIESDAVIKGIIVADDQSGNYYKELIIQDETGGLVIDINSTDLYNLYPIGMEIFINCNGLVMGDYAGTISMGGSLFENGSGNLQVGGIEELLLSEFIVRGQRDQTITPLVTSINSLGTNQISTLVQLSDIQFASGELGKTYANAIDLQTENRDLEDCDNNRIIIRSSGFADFASEFVPDGKGTITAIYSVFNDDKQLFIRNTSDIQFNDTRCDGTVTVNPDTPEVNATISDIKNMVQSGQIITINSDEVISGIVIADDQSGNYFKKLVFQDATGGIVIELDAFDLFENYGIGTEVFVKCNGLLLGSNAGTITLGGSKFTNNNGDDQVGRIDENDISATLFAGQKNQNIPVVTKSLEQLGESDISTLIRIEDVQLVDADAGSTFADAANQFAVNLSLEDCDDNEIILRTSGFADFADQSTPTENGTITAVYGVFNTDKQLFVRNSSDLQFNSERCDGSGGGGGGGNTEILNEGFNNQTQYEVLNLAGWSNIAEVGSIDESWYANNYQGAFYVEGSAFNSEDAENVMWLITPGIEMDGDLSLNFISAQHHWAQNGLSVMISDNFTGDVTTANWMEVNCNLPMESNDWYEMVDSGIISLNDYFSSGTVHVGFRYEGSSPDETTTYQLHNVTVSK